MCVCFNSRADPAAGSGFVAPPAWAARTARHPGYHRAGDGACRDAQNRYGPPGRWLACRAACGLAPPATGLPHSLAVRMPCIANTTTYTHTRVPHRAGRVYAALARARFALTAVPFVHDTQTVVSADEPCWFAFVLFRRAVRRRAPSLSSATDGPRITEAECARLCTSLDSACAAWNHNPTGTAGATASCVLSGAGVLAGAEAVGMALDRGGAGAWRYDAGDGGDDTITRQFLTCVCPPAGSIQRFEAWPASYAMAVGCPCVGG